MLSELVPLTLEKIMQTRSYTVMVLAAKEKRFAIYADPSVGRLLQLYLTGQNKPRPLTHDLMQMVFQGFEIVIKQVVINDLNDTVYFARIFFEQQHGDIREIVEIDARPSDCIVLALMTNVPLYCTREVLEKTIAIED